MALQVEKKFTVGNAITVAVLIVSLLYYVFGVEAKVKDNADGLCQLEEKVKTLEQHDSSDKETIQALTTTLNKISRNQKSLLILNSKIADKMHIEYVIDFEE